jgi:cytochrome c
MINGLKLSLAVTVLALAPASAHAQDGDAGHGKTLFQRQCASCHQAATARNGVGPTLQGLIGRAAGSVDGFKYSPVLKGSGITWTSATLDTFLTNPAAAVKGVRMVQRVTNPKDRLDIIAYLSGL